MILNKINRIMMAPHYSASEGIVTFDFNNYKVSSRTNANIANVTRLSVFLFMERNILGC